MGKRNGSRLHNAGQRGLAFLLRPAPELLLRAQKLRAPEQPLTTWPFSDSAEPSRVRLLRRALLRLISLCAECARTKTSRVAVQSRTAGAPTILRESELPVFATVGEHQHHDHQKNIHKAHFFHAAGIFLHTSFTTQCFFIHDFLEYAGHIFRAVHNRVDERAPMLSSKTERNGEFRLMRRPADTRQDRPQPGQQRQIFSEAEQKPGKERPPQSRYSDSLLTIDVSATM